jgi:hypothetical protein
MRVFAIIFAVFLSASVSAQTAPAIAPPGHLAAFKQPDEDAVARASSTPRRQPEASSPGTPALANTKAASSARPASAASPAHNSPDMQQWRPAAADAVERHGQPFALPGRLPEGGTYLPVVAAVGLLGLVVGFLMRKKTT